MGKKRDLTMRFCKIEKPLSFYEIGAMRSLAKEELDSSTHMACFKAFTLAKDSYFTPEAVAPMSEILDTTEIDREAVDIARMPYGDDQNLTCCKRKVIFFVEEGATFSRFSWHRSAAYKVGQVFARYCETLLSVFSEMGFAVEEGKSHSLTITVGEEKKKVGTVGLNAFGEWFSITNFFNLSVNAEKSGPYAKEGVLINGSLSATSFSDRMGGLLEIGSFDFDLFFAELARRMSDYFRLELIDKPPTEQEYAAWEIEAEVLKDPAWTSNGISSKLNKVNRDSIREASAELFVPEVRQHPLTENVDVVRTPKITEGV